MTDTNAQGKLVLDNGQLIHLFGISTGGVFTDGAEAEIYTKDLSALQNQLWKVAEGRRIRELALQLADGSILTTVKVYSPNGGTIASWRGNERTGNNMLVNLSVKGLNLLIEKGTAIKLNCAD